MREPSYLEIDGEVYQNGTFENPYRQGEQELRKAPRIYKALFWLEGLLPSWMKKKEEEPPLFV